jgi:hypothetical protein
MLDRTPLFGIEGFEVRGCSLHPSTRNQS